MEYIFNVSIVYVKYTSREGYMKEFFRRPFSRGSPGYVIVLVGKFENNQGLQFAC